MDVLIRSFPLAAKRSLMLLTTSVVGLNGNCWALSTIRALNPAT